MKLKLAVVESTGTGSWSEITEHGTLKSQLVKTDVLSFSQKNIEGEARVCLFIKETEEDAPKMLSLSVRLSKLVRKALTQGAKKVEVLKSLLNLKVIENTEGVFFLVPEGKPSEGFSLADLAKGESIALESLIA